MPKTFSREAMHPIRGQMPVMQFCLPEQLEIDPSYQRSIENGESQQLIVHIAHNWDWRRCQFLTVGRRDGRLFVVDGQHRLAAARLRGDIQQLPCVIGDYANVAEEAKLFEDLNGRRRPVSAIDKFRAAIVAGDPDCIAISAAMGRAGLKLAPHTNPTRWQPGELANIGGIRKAWKTHGPAATELAMVLLADAFKGQVLTYAGTVFLGLVAVCAGPDGKGTIGDAELLRLIGVLGSKTQEQWRKAALARMAKTGEGWATAMTQVLRDAIGAGVDRLPSHMLVAPKPVPPLPPVRPMPMPASGVGGPAFGDRFDRRKAGDQFCAQCDKLVSPDRARRCRSAWCKVRDLASSSEAVGQTKTAAGSAAAGGQGRAA